MGVNKLKYRQPTVPSGDGYVLPFFMCPPGRAMIDGLLVLEVNPSRGQWALQYPTKWKTRTTQYYGDLRVTARLTRRLCFEPGRARMAFQFTRSDFSGGR